MNLICIESPLSGNVERNIAYADACMFDALERGEAPYLGHLLYPRVYDDTNELHRTAGIAAHLAWLERSDRVVIYADYGVSRGMDDALTVARRIHKPIQWRQLGPEWRARRTFRTPGF